ncbi:hypothetical protein FQR65_LT10294 [Abscondita terminalis]|nr:hypothetical protein FQR65_LT10294 [Abscondita terminalis]
MLAHNVVITLVLADLAIIVIYFNNFIVQQLNKVLFALYMSYEKELERLQKLWELVQVEDIVNTIPDDDEDFDEEDCVEERIEDSESEQELEVEVVEDSVERQYSNSSKKKENIMTPSLLAKTN